jgi:hypothetical protein
VGETSSLTERERQGESEKERRHSSFDSLSLSVVYSPRRKTERGESDPIGWAVESKSAFVTIDFSKDYSLSLFLSLSPDHQTLFLSHPLSPLSLPP